MLRALLRAQVVTAAGIFALSLTLDARADDAETKRLRSVFQQATEFEQAQNWGEALKRFREVAQVKMSPQVRYHIALCEENLGNLAAALGGYRLALKNASEMPEAIRKELEAREKELEVRIPRAKFVRSKGSEAARLELDGNAIGTSSEALPLDPGGHTVVASAPGFEPFKQVFTAKERETVTVVVKLVPLPAGKRDRDVGGAGSAGPAAANKPGGLQRTIGWTSIGVGGASLVLGGVFLALRQSSLSSLDQSCPTRTNCPPSERDNYDSAKMYSVLSPVFLGIGVVGVGVGVTLLLTQPKATQERASRPSLELLLAAPGSEAGASLRGTF